jgi:hypothetical protein
MRERSKSESRTRGSLQLPPSCLGCFPTIFLECQPTLRAFKQMRRATNVNESFPNAFFCGELLGKLFAINLSVYLGCQKFFKVLGSIGMPSVSFIRSRVPMPLVCLGNVIVGMKRIRDIIRQGLFRLSDNRLISRFYLIRDELCHGDR